MAVLVVNQLKKQFTSRDWPWSKKTTFTAVNGISFELQPAEILGLLGPNGAGKTTTIEMLLGTLTPSAGTISYFGKDFLTHRSDILKKVTFASAYVKLPSRLTIEENLDIFARLYGVPAAERSERIKRFLIMFDMWQYRNKQTANLSAGQITRVMLAKAFIPHPEVVLLDEPTASLDPDVAREVRQFVLEQKEQQGISVLFTSHNMDEVTQVCDRVLVMKKGNIIANNTPLELAASVSRCRVSLIISNGLDKAIQHATTHQFTYKLYERTIEIEIDEHAIAPLLTKLVHAGVEYTQISIDKPTLEDYFVSISQKKE